MSSFFLCAHNIMVPVILILGGDNLTKLESEFEGVRIHIPRDSNTVSLRGPEDNVKKCRIKLVTEIATYRVSDTMDLTPGQHSDISNDVDTIKRIAGSSGTSISLIEGSIKIRGVSRDVRDAKALLREHFSGSYSGYIDLNVPQYDRLKSTLSKDASHFERVKLSTGAVVVLDETESAIKITGKKANVKKAKLSLMGFLDFVFPKQIQTVKVHKTLFKSMCDPEKLAEVAVATSASVYLDRDLISVVVNSESADDATKAVELVNARLVESEKLNYVFRLATADAWLLPVIIGKAGKNVKKIEAATGCSIDVFKDELSVVVRGESKDAVQSGKEAVEAIVDQARKECVFVELPESAIPAFVGKGGAHIKQLSAAHEVEIEKTKKHQSTIKITGKEEAGELHSTIVACHLYALCLITALGFFSCKCKGFGSFVVERMGSESHRPLNRCRGTIHSSNHWEVWRDYSIHSKGYQMQN